MSSKESSGHKHNSSKKPDDGTSLKDSSSKETKKSSKDNPGKHSKKDPNISTSERVIGSVHLVGKFKSKCKSKHTMTVKDFAKQSSRKDHGNKRQHAYLFL